MDTLLKDLRFSARALWREPGSAAISVLILALGIGLSTFMFSLVYGVFFRGLDVPEADRIAVVQFVRAEGNGVQAPLRSHDFLDLRERLTTFQGLAAYYGGSVSLADDEGSSRHQALWVTANAFDVLGVRPHLGRTFAADEDAPGAPPTVLLGYHVWRDEYGSDPEVLGRTVRVDGTQGTIVGVMPEGFRWPSTHDVWVTMNDDPSTVARGEGRWYAVVGRLADGVSWEQAGGDVARVATLLEREHPEINEGVSGRVLTVSQQQNGEEITLIFGAMMVAVLCVLLVACANVANLLLARAAIHTREAGVRVALGAGRLRTMLPFLAEAVVLASAGAILGTGLAYWGVGLFDRVTATGLTGRPYFMVFQVDLPILLWVVGITLLTALLAGIAPALQVSRVDVNTILKDESRGSSGLHMGRLSRALVMVEVALSVALLVGAGLMTKSMVQLGRFELPFEPEAYRTGRVTIVETDYPDREARQAFWTELDRRLRSVPGISSVSLSSSTPATGSGLSAIRLEGRVYEEEADRPQVHGEIVSPAYFDVLDVSLVEGRSFDEGLTRDDARVAVVNRSFADRFWPGESPIGRRFRTGTADTVPWLSIVGVVPDLQMQGFQPTGSPSSIPAGFYLPVGQSDPTTMNLVVRPVPGSGDAVMAGMRDAIRAIDPDVPLYELRTLDAAIHESNWFYGVFGSVFIVFGLAALFMASAGLYGVLSFSVNRRTQEMGIRMALGAEGGRVTRLVLRQGLLQIGVGLVIGLLMAAGVSNVVSALMFQVDPRDPTVFGGVVAMILLVGVVASLVPARRATRVDPMVALRAD